MCLMCGINLILSSWHNSSNNPRSQEIGLACLHHRIYILLKTMLVHDVSGVSSQCFDFQFICVIVFLISFLVLHFFVTLLPSLCLASLDYINNCVFTLLDARRLSSACRFLHSPKGVIVFFYISIEEGSKKCQLQKMPITEL